MNEPRKPAQHTKFFRRKYLVNPRFQVKMMIYVGALALGIAVMLYAAHAYFFWKFIEVGTDAGFAADNPFFKFIERQSRKMDIMFFGVSGFVFLCLLVFGTLISHRIAGPLYRLHRHMLAVARGETQAPVNFRKRDFFPELAEGFNRQLEYWRERRQK